MWTQLIAYEFTYIPLSSASGDSEDSASELDWFIGSPYIVIYNGKIALIAGTARLYL